MKDSIITVVGGLTGIIVGLIISATVFGTVRAAPAYEDQKHADAGRAVSEFVQAINMTSAVVNKANQSLALRRILLRYIDLDIIGLYTISSQSTTATEKKAFLGAFKAYFADTYAAKLVKLKLKDFKIVDARKVGKRDILVTTTILTSKGTTKLHWRVRAGKIIDISVAGINLSRTLKNEFSSLLRSGGVNNLIKVLLNKVSSQVSI